MGSSYAERRRDRQLSHNEKCTENGISRASPIALHLAYPPTGATSYKGSIQETLYEEGSNGYEKRLAGG